MIWQEPKPHSGGDPYLEWSQRTGFRGHEAIVDGLGLVPLLIERQSGASLPGSDLLISPVHRTSESAFITAWAPARKLPTIGIQRKEFALPLSGVCAMDEKAVRLRKAKGRLVIGVIDRGCAFLNGSFRERSSTPKASTKTRILALWNQGMAQPAAPSHWRPVTQFGYGCCIEQAGIDSIIRRLGADYTEAQAYADVGYLVERQKTGGRALLVERSHGTHVLDSAAGLVMQRPGLGQSKPLEADAAEAADLVFVDSPGLGRDDSTGASSGAFLLDAIHFIYRKAGVGARVVINISLGALAGPHDGTSLTEAAIDEFLRSHRNVLITLAAGNAAQESWHAVGKLQAAGMSRQENVFGRKGESSSSKASMVWQTLPDDHTDSFLELWFRNDVGKAPSGVQIRVTPPGCPAIEAVGLGQCAVMTDSDSDVPRAMVLFSGPGGAQGKDAMVLVAVGPSRASASTNAASRPVAPFGQWLIELENASAYESVKFDAWIQRDEPGLSGRGEGVQSFLSSTAGDTRIDGSGAFSSLATGKATIVVGATDQESGAITAYTARGSLDKDRRWVRDLDIVTSADESPSTIGLYAAGVLSGSMFRMGGTSVAAPRVARFLANSLMSPLSPLGPPVSVACEEVREWLRRGGQGSLKPPEQSRPQIGATEMPATPDRRHREPFALLPDPKGGLSILERR